MARRLVEDHDRRALRAACGRSRSAASRRPRAGSRARRRSCRSPRAARRSRRGSARRGTRPRARPGWRRASRSAGCRPRTRGRDADPGDHADRGAQRALRERADVMPVDAHRSSGHVVEARDERRRASSCRRRDGPTSATSWPGSTTADTWCSTSTPGDAVERRNAAVEPGRRRPRARRPTPTRRPGSGTLTSSNSTLTGRIDQVDARPGASSSGFGASSTSKTRSNETSAVIDVDARVREARERSVDAPDVGGEGDEGADRDRPGDDELGAEAVDHGSADAATRPRATKNTRPYIALLMPMSRTRLARFENDCRLGVGVAVELDQHGAADVEALSHRRVHRRVEVHLLTSDRLEPTTDPLGRKDEDRQHEQRDDGELPLEGQHRDKGQREGDDVRDDGAERAGHRVLRADHVVVHPADQRAGLRAGEERDGLTLHAVEQRRPQLVDQALADPGRPPTLRNRQESVAESGQHDETGEHPDLGAIRPTGSRRRASAAAAAAAPGRGSASSTIVRRKPTIMPAVGPSERPGALQDLRIDLCPSDALGIVPEHPVGSTNHHAHCCGGYGPRFCAPHPPLRSPGAPARPHRRRRARVRSVR